MAFDIAVVGTSWGGLSALREFVGGLPTQLPLAVLVVQHRHRESGSLLSTLLQDSTSRAVAEVEDKAPIVPGIVHVAPADYHLLVEDGHFALTTDAPVHYSRPSIDVTFSSTADTYGSRAIGIVLTGANADGACGLRRIVDRGGLAFVQLPSTAESPAMPAAALQAVPEAQVASIRDIASAIAKLAAAPPVASPSRADAQSHSSTDRAPDAP